MASPKKNTKQAKSPAKSSRIGKKKREEIIEYYRPIFEKNLSMHLRRNQLQDNRPTLIFSSLGIPKDLQAIERGNNEPCPVCSYLPYAKNIIARPRLTLTEKDAEKSLRELGFSDDFVENYMEEFRKETTERRENRKGAWGIPNIRDYISWHGAWLIFEFPWLTVTAAARILEDLLIENKYTPGKGTIKAHLKKFMLTLQVADYDPEWAGPPPLREIAELTEYTSNLNKYISLISKEKKLKTIAKTFVKVGLGNLPKHYRVKMNDERRIFEAIQARRKADGKGGTKD